MDLITTFLYIVFVLSAIILVVVILLQEGKGGGLTDALGTGGQQTFGVGASGINKFTGWCAAVFLCSALGIHYMNRVSINRSAASEPFGEQLTPPAGGNDAGGAPTDGNPGTGGTTPTPPPGQNGAPPSEPPK